MSRHVKPSCVAPRTNLFRLARLLAVRAASLSACAVLLAGCASPGPPRPPSLLLPQRATLAAERSAGDVELTFPLPTHTTDGQPVRAATTARICRAIRAGACLQLTELTLPAPGIPAPGTGSGPQSEFHYRDALPPALLAVPRQLLSYRVELVGPRGRSAGPSEAAFAASGPAPAPVQGFAAQGSRAGIRLTWQAAPEPGTEIVLRRELLTPGPRERGAAGRTRTSSTVPAIKPHTPVVAAPAHKHDDDTIAWLLATPPQDGAAQAVPNPYGADAGGSLDAAAKFGNRYRYTAFRQTTLTLGTKTLTLRSAPSGAVEVEFRNIYPPAVPTGLLVAAFNATPATDANKPHATVIDLSWQPDLDAELQGYNVYRQPIDAAGKPVGAATRLNAQPVPQSAYQDTTLPAGMACRYTVTAIDRAGNESAPSAPAEFVPGG